MLGEVLIPVAAAYNKCLHNLPGSGKCRQHRHNAPLSVPAAAADTREVSKVAAGLPAAVKAVVGKDPAEEDNVNFLTHYIKVPRLTAGGFSFYIGL